MKEFSTEDYELIDSYLKNELTEEENTEMELRIASDPDWEREVEWYRKFEFGSRYLLNKKMFAEMHKKLEKEGKLEIEEKNLIFLVFTKHWQKIAAVLSIGLFASLIWYLNKPIVQETVNNSKPDTVIHINITVKEKSNVLINESPRALDNIASQLQTSIDKMDENPDKAIKQLQALGRTNAGLKQRDSLTYGSTESNNVSKPLLNAVAENQRKFFLGLIYLRKQNSIEAIKYFQQIQAPLKANANWYMALAYIQNSDSEKARKILQIIVNDKTNPYQEDANEILDELEK